MQRLYYGEYQASRRRVFFQAFDQTDGVTPEVGEAGVQPQVFIQGAGAAVTANVGVLIASQTASGTYYSEFASAAASPLLALGIHRMVADSANTGPMDELFEVVPHPYLHDGTAQAGGAQVITLAAGASAVDQAYIDGFVTLIGGTGAGQVRQIAGYVGATKVATLDAAWQVQPDATSVYIVEPGSRLPALAGVWDALTANQTLAGSFGELFNPFRRGTAQAGSSSTITLDAGASATNDFYKGALLRIVGGLGVGQSQFISSYVGATKVATMGANWAVSPNNSSIFIIYPFGVIPGATAPTAITVAAAVWEALLADHNVAGSYGAGVRIEPTAAALFADTLLNRNIGGGDNSFPTVEFALCFLAGKWTDNGDGTITVFGSDDVSVLGTIAFSTRARDAIGGIDSSPA